MPGNYTRRAAGLLLFVRTFFAYVTTLSATFRSSLALGKVVCILSCCINCVTIVLCVEKIRMSSCSLQYGKLGIMSTNRNIAHLWAASLPNLRLMVITAAAC